MKCGYCKRFANGIRDEKGGKDRVSYRLCSKKQVFVTSDDEWCGKFRLRNYFYCDTFNIWITLKACLYRKNHGRKLGLDECEFCKQSHEIAVVKQWKAEHDEKKKASKPKKRVLKKSKTETKTRTLKVRKGEVKKKSRQLNKKKRVLKRRL